MKQQTFEKRVLGYRYESRIRAGPNGERYIGSWSERITTWHPKRLEGSDIRNAVELVPDMHAEDPVAYYYQSRVDSGEGWSEWSEYISEFHPEELEEGPLSYEIQEVVPLQVGDEIAVDTGSEVVMGGGG